MSTFRPMKAETLLDRSQIIFPAFMSTKIDGIRCVIKDGIACSQKLLPIPNKFINLGLAGLPSLDGELVAHSATAKNGFDKSQSAIMSRDGQPDWLYYVFDSFERPNLPFTERWKTVRRIVRELDHPRIQLVRHVIIESLRDLESFEQEWLEEGFEGAMLRSPSGLYKYGRSTLKQGWLLKIVKRFTAEAIVVGFAERLHNDNEKERDHLGMAKRSKKKAGLSGMNTLGALQVKWVKPPKDIKREPGFQFNTEAYDFEIGTGFTDAQRAEIWANKKKWLKAKVTFEYRESTKDGKPRFPAFKGRRYD